jgi:hypothetical protein
MPVRDSRTNQRLLPTPQIPEAFSDVTITQAKSLFPDMSDGEQNRPFIEGDHLQGGDAWVGPGPKMGDAAYRDFLDLLEVAFVSKNVLDECCDRLTGAVVGWEPRWGWVLRRFDTEENPQTPEETAEIQELESAMTEWWDQMQIHRKLKLLIYNMLWAKQSAWRLYVPSGMTNAAGQIDGIDSLEKAFARIFLDIPDPANATVWEHPETKQRLGICLLTQADGSEKAELCYLETDGRTTIRIVPGDGAGVATGTNDFGGHLTIYAVTLDKPLVREQERSLQKALNMTLTLLEKGLVDNHFVEKLFMNALPPGHWEYESDGKTRKQFVVDKRPTGGRTDSYIQGIDYQDVDATTGAQKTVVKDPSIYVRQPLDPNGTIQGSEYWYQALLESMRQDHILINQLATPSGKSREHSRGDFIDSTKDPVMQADLAGRELLLTAACVVEAFLNQKGKWTKKYRPVFKCRPNYGPLSVAERQQNVIEAEKGFLSDETVMALNGTDDVDAELALIRETPRAKLSLSSLRADVIIKWATDFPREVALRMAGYTDEQIKDIMGMVTKSKSLDPGENPPPIPAGGNPPNPAKTSAGKPIPPAGNRPSTKPQARN